MAERPKTKCGSCKNCLTKSETFGGKCLNILAVSKHSTMIKTTKKSSFESVVAQLAKKKHQPQKTNNSKGLICGHHEDQACQKNDSKMIVNQDSFTPDCKIKKERTQFQESQQHWFGNSGVIWHGIQQEKKKKRSNSRK
mmetsp:Transcript_23625/g.30875  ORF Transcript_23625/g.30875 Transcript_23625/m.30875 type:complete len:139 (+) Transcript_23625:231-647(+)